MGVSSSLEVNCEMVFECLIKKKKKVTFSLEMALPLRSPLQVVTKGIKIIRKCPSQRKCSERSKKGRELRLRDEQIVGREASEE